MVQVLVLLMNTVLEWGCGSAGEESGQVQLPSGAIDFSPRVNIQCRLSHSVCAASVSCDMHQHLCTQ